MRREAILVDINIANGLQSFVGQKSGDVPSSSGLHNEINNIGMAAVTPYYLLANHVGAQKVAVKVGKGDDLIRSSNASLSSMSSGSSSSSDSRNKTCNGVTEPTVRPWIPEVKPFILNGSENSLNITSTPSGM